MPALCKRRGESRWRAQVKVNGKVAASKWFKGGPRGGPEYRKAVAWEETEKKRLEEMPTATVSLTLIDWANQYLDYAKERHAPITYKEKFRAFHRLLRAVPKETPVEDLDMLTVLHHLRKQVKTRSGNAANKDRKNLATGWSWGRKYLPVFPGGNPFLSVEKFPEQRSPRYVPPEADFDKVFEVTEGQDRVMLMAFLYLAARRKEVFRLLWQDVDYVNNRVRLWTRKRVGGNLEADWVPLAGELKAELLWWWENRPVKDAPSIFVCLDTTPFCEEYYGKPFRARIHFMERICKRAGVQPFGFHAIRHLTATILYHKGYPVSVIQRILRHKHPSTTEQYLKDLGLDAAREALEQGLGKRGLAKVVDLPIRKVGT